MKTITCAAIVALLAGAVMVTQARATELWDPHLRGVNEGLAPGASLPEGVYGVLDNYWAGYAQYNNSGNKTGVKVDALVEVPIVLWQTGLTFLGADYAVALAQPFDYTDLKLAGAAGLSNSGHWGTYNTLVIPGQLSWKLPNDFHVMTGLTVYVDDASSSSASPPSGGGLGAGNSFWTLEPNLAVSWLHDGWNLTADIHYAYNFEDGKTHYTSGQEIAIDYTATKTFGKWTAGIGAHQENQVTDDKGLGAVAAGCANKGGCRVANYGIGPLVGYQFGGINILAQWDQNIATKNDIAGTIVNIRLVTAF